MLKTILNECLIDFSIKSETPLLIKSGMERVEDPDMFPIMTFRIRNGKGNDEVFIPGSSLKGVIRSHSERITRTLRQGKEAACCNPFEKDKKNKNVPEFACSNYFEEYKHQKKIKKLNGIEAYRQSCLICRLFGSTESASRLIVRDAYLKDGCNVKSETRTGVGIDRFTGGVASGPFSLEVATNAEFGTQLYIRNFELWQLGLLAYVFKDFEDGIIPIGYGKSRGFGKVTGTVDKVELRYLGKNKPSAQNIRGIRKMVEENEYGFYEEENKDFKAEEGLPSSVPDEFGFRQSYVLKSEYEIKSLWQTVAPIWNNCVNDYKSERVKLE
jgi:CRISPR-associated RAMP protein (TIGR02581 family)